MSAREWTFAIVVLVAMCFLAANSRAPSVAQPSFVTRLLQVLSLGKLLLVQADPPDVPEAPDEFKRAFAAPPPPRSAGPDGFPALELGDNW